MAKSLQTAGIEELAKFSRRVSRQFGMGRISREDHDRLQKMVIQINSFVAQMDELSEQGPKGQNENGK